MSLLGAVAYLALTRVDVLVFICALQRYAATPQIQHVKRLNKVVKWVQRHPKKLHFKRLDALATDGTQLHILSDAQQA